MRWMPRLRMLLARRPWIYWSFVALLAAGAGLTVAASVADMRRARESWGETAPVLVATRAIAPGEMLDGSVAATQFPVALVPGSAVTDFAPGAAAIQRITAGEVVVDADVGGAAGSLALLPDGWLAIAIDGADGALFHVGDSAAVLAAGQVVAAKAVVVRILADAVVIGVPRNDAALVADAAIQHSAVIALGADEAR